VLYIFESSRCIEKDRLMPEEDRGSPPPAVGKGLRINMRLMMGVYYKPLDAGLHQVVHGIGNDGAVVKRQKRFGAALGEGPQSHAQSRAENEGRFEPFS